MAVSFAPYLFFDGRCEEALAFYREVFGGEVMELNRFAGSPLAETMAPEAAQKIMHATFAAPGITFMASDGGEGTGASERIRLSVGSADADEGQRIFEALARGGRVVMPYEKQFWGASFGMLVDRFGIPWMVNAGMA